MDGNEALYNYLNSGDIEEMNDPSSYDDNSNGNSNQDSATSFGNDRLDSDDFEPQAKRFRTEDFENYDRENSNSGGGIPSLLNINVPPPNASSSSQKSPTVWENNSGFNNNSNNGAFNNNANNQKPTQRTREGRRQGSRWSSRR